MVTHVSAPAISVPSEPTSQVVMIIGAVIGVAILVAALCWVACCTSCIAYVCATNPRLDDYREARVRAKIKGRPGHYVV